MRNSEIISIGSCELKKDNYIMSLIEKRKMIKRADAFKDEAMTNQEIVGFTVKGKDGNKNEGKK